MPTLLIQHADLLATMDDADTRWEDGALYIVDNVIQQVGPSDQLPQMADELIDVRGMVILPGLVNTHHHFYQTLTRNLPAAQNANLFTWLKTLYPIWANLTPEAIAVSSKIAIAELMLSGCTTSSDHTYIWPNGARLDDQIQAARELGFRFHAARGSMSVGESQGGLPPDRVVEDEGAILHDSMFGRTPIELAEDLGWVGPDVWHAHVVHPSADEVIRLGHTHTGAAHCPSSNMRLASGIAPLRALQRAGARVGLGVDGSASNDGSHMLAEARQALLLHRVLGDPAGLTALEALRLATRGGAAVLGRDDIGQLAPGMAADLIGYRLDTVGLAGGAVHDPLAALVFCQPPNIDLSVIDGRVRVRDGRLLGVDLPPLIARHNAFARALARGERP